jgi:UDP-GlcNAc:undecaprenyl-phosphate/decaprenyl-phosphate GlcNAc-1-phosphate transferase
MVWLIIGFVAAFVRSVGFTHRVREIGVRLALVDVPDGGRRIHDRPTPRIGGVGIFAAVLLVVLIGALLLSGGFAANADFNALGTLLVGGLAIFALGLWDDARGVAAREKFAIQILIACGVFLGGIRIDGITLPGGLLEFPLWASMAITVGWIVLITNAFNLIDGSDGVAAGAALFAAVAIGIVSLFGSDPLGAFIAFVLAGAILGFLFFNFPPASIFLGDCGSLFLGFMLAGLGVITAQKGPTALAVAIPVVSFALPILDTILAVMRRLLRGEAIFNADRGHIHHRLRDLGHSPRRVALLLYAASALFALISLLLIQPSGASAAIAFIVVGSGIFLAVQRLHIPELLELQRILGRGMQQRTVIAHNVRIREAVRRLAHAETTEDIFGVVEFAFSNGEFSRAEIVLKHSFPLPPQRLSQLRRTEAGFSWEWQDRRASSGSEWEIALPFRDAQGKPIGRLSLWHYGDGEHLLTDIRLIARELHPALQRALTRAEPERGGFAVPLGPRILPISDLRGRPSA